LAEPTSFRDLKVEETELLPEVREKLRSPMAAFQQLGFRTPWFHKDKQSLIPAQVGAVVLLHESGQAVAKVIYVKQTSGTVRIEKLVCAILSPLNNGNILCTGNRRREMLSPPGYETECLLRASPERLWQRHQEKLNKLRNRNPPVRIRNLLRRTRDPPVSIPHAPRRLRRDDARRS
jgi:hypothetical protein